MSKLIRGSQWRRWDLHVHTPSSYDYEDKSISDDKIIDEIAKKTICAIAITDHHVMDVARIINLQKLGTQKDITVFPGIEMKAEMRGEEPIHFIGIFPENCNLEYVWGEIASKTEIASQKASGKQDNEIYCDLKDTCKLIHNLGGLISIHAGSKSNSIEVITNALPLTMAQKRDIVDNIDIFELGKTADIQGYIEKVFPCIKKVLPMIMCSDNHKITDYTFKETCWIKADTTFSGLKQIVFEPLGRVALQEQEPEAKNPYSVIDSIRFLDRRNEPDFNETWIPLNPNLNSIIGGKSSGKSLLIYHIAKTIDRSRIDSINREEGTHKLIEYKFEHDPQFDFEVKWADGISYSLKSKEKPNRPITFIPQLYLNRLAEDQREELNQLVLKMLMDSSGAYKTFREEIKIRIDNLKKDVFSEIENYFRLERDLATKTSELAELGDQKAIEKNIKVISGKLEELRKESEFTVNDDKKYKELTDKKLLVANSLSAKNDLISVLSLLRDGFISFKNDINDVIQNKINDNVPSLRSITDDGIRGKVDKIFSNISTKLSSEIEKCIIADFAEIEQIENERKVLENAFLDLDKQLNPYTEKVKNRTVFDELQKSITEEAAKLKAIIAKTAERDKLLEKRQTKQISDKYASLFSCYIDILAENDKYKTVPDTDNLEIGSKIAFSKKKFSENFLNKIDRRTSLTEQLGDCFNPAGEYVFEKDKHVACITGMISMVALGQVALRQGFDDEHALLSLLDDYFSIDFNLLQDGDNLLSMSPGKRGIILFQLFLHLSKSTNPILIDQPEDNLDNRTVYQELNDFIKAKKSKRQIIIVSHNPNLVVSTDAENIIVANQSGQNRSGKNSKFKFEYVNGALENSFRKTDADGVLNQCGIREHVCEILEGGEEAFEKRERKYGLK